jgi:hypothetical protein
MGDNAQPETSPPEWTRLLINAVYGLCIVVGLLVGVYGLYILVVDVLIVEEPNVVGLLLGLLLAVGGFGLLAFAINMLFARWYSDARYSPRRWVLALLGAVAAGAMGYVVFALLRGI